MFNKLTSEPNTIIRIKTSYKRLNTVLFTSKLCDAAETGNNFTVMQSSLKFLKTVCRNFPGFTNTQHLNDDINFQFKYDYHYTQENRAQQTGRLRPDAEYNVPFWLWQESAALFSLLAKWSIKEEKGLIPFWPAWKQQQIWKEFVYDQSEDSDHQATNGAQGRRNDREGKESHI